MEKINIISLCCALFLEIYGIITRDVVAIIIGFQMLLISELERIGEKIR
jgi:hypothetical protein